MTNETQIGTPGYRDAMGRLLMLYTQIDKLIMEVCGEKIVSAPDESAKLALAKQVGDESRHVSIQRQWIKQFGTDPAPVISSAQEDQIRAHFRELPWLDFLADMYVCVEALGSDAVEQIVPLTDPGTRESLRIPLTDELDHIHFGISRLKQELAKLSAPERHKFLDGLPDRISKVSRTLHGLGLNLPGMFEAVGANYDTLRQGVLARRDDLLREVSIPTP